MGKLRKIMEKKNRYDKNRKINETVIEGKQTGQNVRQKKQESKVEEGTVRSKCCRLLREQLKDF